MRVKRLLAPVAAGAMMVAGMAVVGVPAASAATTISPTCGAGPITMISGDTFTFTPDNTCSFVSWSSGTGISPSEITVTVNGTPVNRGTRTAIPSGATVLFNYTGSVAGGASIGFEPNAGAITQYMINLTGGGGGGAAGSSSGSAPVPVIQQFGLPASGNCEDGATEAMNLAGVSSGGWGISWAQWVNERLGGSVCTRTLMYDTSLSKWVVN